MHIIRECYLGNSRLNGAAQNLINFYKKCTKYVYVYNHEIFLTIMCNR